MEEGLVCFNLDGERKWSLAVSGIARLAVDRKGRIYGVTDRGRIRSFSHSGEMLWDSGTEPGEVVSLALREDDVLYPDGGRGHLPGRCGGFRKLLPGAGTAGSRLSDRRGRLCFFDRENRFISLDFESGTEDVLFTVPAVPSLPLVTETGLILFGASDWRFYAYGGENPDKGWSQFRANPAGTALFTQCYPRKPRKSFTGTMRAGSITITLPRPMIR